MKKTVKILCLVLTAAMALTAIATVAVVHLVTSDSSDEDIYLSDDIRPMEYVALNSFFEDNPVDVEREEWEYINPYYEQYSPTENTSNFHSHATAVYENINGRTVTVDTLYRNYGEALNDPNYSLAVLIYQGIQYKIAHPDENVEISFSALRFSPTLGACLNPSSPYYGYVKAMYDEDCDANGFVRISYLFVEAARLGIKVNILASKESYGTKQYNNETGKTYTHAEPHFKTYFDKAYDYSCYDEYAPGKKVSDFLTVRQVEWAYKDKGDAEIVHVKTCAVSAYRDKYGVDHEYGVWFSSTNLDTANYKGHNANGCSQSGMIISNHPDIYNVSKNYLLLTMQYYEREAVFEFRRVAKEMTEKQIYAHLNGTIDSIPYEERIVYLGTENDNVFEAYFTPLSGNVDDWDTTLNPYCKYVQEFYNSDNNEDVIFSFNNANFTNKFQVSNLLVEAIEYKFIENKRPGNKLNLRCQNGEFPTLLELKAGKDLSYVNIKTKTSEHVHEKDILMSYVIDGERKYVSILNSCNFNSGALFYQTNHIIVIKETEETGHTVFSSLIDKETKGNITCAE